MPGKNFNFFMKNIAGFSVDFHTEKYLANSCRNLEQVLEDFCPTLPDKIFRNLTKFMQDIWTIFSRHH